MKNDSDITLATHEVETLDMRIRCLAIFSQLNPEEEEKWINLNDKLREPGGVLQEVSAMWSPLCLVGNPGHAASTMRRARHLNVYVNGCLFESWDKARQAGQLLSGKILQ